MGKNKQNKAKKEHAVFKVAGVRKAKTKTVNTNLKKLNVKNKNKTEEANKKFEEVQKVLTQETSKSKVRTASKVPSSSSKSAAPDMDTTMDAFSKLGHK